MTKKASNVAKTVGIGLLAGTAAMAVGGVVMNQKNSKSSMKHMKKTAGKAVENMSKIIGSVESMLK